MLYCLKAFSALTSWVIAFIGDKLKLATMKIKFWHLS